jgi:CheY-like chemotaxis protein
MSAAEAVLAAALMEVERLRAELDAASRERDRLDAELRQARNRETVGRLAGGLAHDFSNLITVISGYSELLIDRLDRGDPTLRGSVEGIQRTAEWGHTLTRQLLAASRPDDAGDIVVNLNDVVTSVEPVLRRMVGVTGHLLTRLDPAVRPVRANVGQLEQALACLAATAGRELGPDGLLTIATADVSLPASDAHRLGVRPGRYAQLSVLATDDGQPHDSDGRRGLSAAEGIAVRCGGALRIGTASPGGPSFEMYLPGLDEAGLATPSRLELPGGRETVLVVEDEQPVRELIGDVLRLHGYTVLEAQDGDEALVVGERHPAPIHLLIADVVMPGVPAGTLAQRLADTRPGLKVLYISGYTDELIRQHVLLRLGPDFLQKPFTVDALARKVRELLDAA